MAAVCIRLVVGIDVIVCICCSIRKCGRQDCCPIAADHSRSQTQIYQNLLICSRFNALKVILGHQDENILQAEFHEAELP